MSNKKFNARHGVSVGSTPVDVIDDTGAVLTNAATATKLLNSRTISISGDVVATGSFDGSGNLDLAATIQANSVALGTDTTGNYMVDVSAGTGVSVSHTQGEGSTATVSIGQAVGTSDNVTFNNLTLAGELRGPATFVIDPAAVGDNTGTLVIKGNLQVDGTTTTINSTTLTVDDLVLTLGGDTAPASDDTFDKGIEYRWFDTQARVGFFGFDRSTGKLTFIPQSSLSSGVYSGTTGEIDAKIDWSNILNKPTIDNTTYNHLAVTTTGGALIRLNSSSSVNDDIKLASGTNVTVAYTNDDTITISSTNTDTTYSIKASAQTNGAGIDLDAGGSGSGTDTVKILGSSGTTVTRTDADTITISSTSVGDGTLSVATKSAGATNTDVTLELSGAYSANTSTNRTIKAVVGPALTNLATLMATAGPGFIRRTLTADEFSVDTNTYLTAEADTLATVTARGATTTAQITVDSVLTTNNNNGTNFRVGDDAWIGDINTANTIRVTGLQDTTKGYIVFGDGDATALGRSGTGALTYGGNTIYHSGNLPTYLTAESDTLSSVTGRGATTATDITLGNGVATSTTNFAGTSVNYLITSSTGSLILKTKDQTTTYSRNVNIQTGNSTQAGGNSGGILIKTGNATGGSDAFAGDISMYPGSSDGTAAIVTITGGESASGPVSTGGYVRIKGGSSTTTTTTQARGGNVYIYGGDVTSSNNFTKYTGSVYIEGGGATGSGTITFGTVNIGRTSGSSSYGTSAINIGNNLITTTIDGTVKLPNVGTSGFVKLGAGGELSADTNTYAVSSHTHSYLPLSGGTLTGNLFFANATSPNTNYIQFGDNTGWMLRFMTNVSGTATERFKFSDQGAFTAVSGISGTTLTSTVATGTAPLTVTSTTAVANLNADLLDGNHASAFALSGHTHSYLSSESDTLATVTARGATTSTAVTLSSTNNHYSGHFYYDSFDSAGNHYPHFNDGGSGSGSKVNWRLFTGATNSVIHTWTTALATFNTDTQVNGKVIVSNSSTYMTRNSTTGCLEFYV